VVSNNQDVDDLMIRRFLRARDLDMEKASSLFLKYLKWRRTFVPNGSISASEVPHEIAQNKMFLQGFDKKGRPIAVLLGARHFQSEGGIEEFKRMFFFPLLLSIHITARFPFGAKNLKTII
jgi:hypothetical protein